MENRHKSLEARLNAHREILIQLAAALMQQGKEIDAAMFAPDGDLAVLDQEEDPGVVPGEAYAEQAQTAAELRSILEAASQRAAAMKR
ncbi:hypothetical protein [Rhizobium sp. L1K21]|uniref:hypothetical protein n=1 Tax=Rhizobium sp. L1K21 TaxID=2954933 RepID=UPI0020924320|nr:hypothetical protein [Rhizobium sp. L1K21]MCO6187844.1 hypothetical protein [Rhizobium sp. L1K21]